MSSESCNSCQSPIFFNFFFFKKTKKKKLVKKARRTVSLPNSRSIAGYDNGATLGGFSGTPFQGERLDANLLRISSGKTRVN